MTSLLCAAAVTLAAIAVEPAGEPRLDLGGRIVDIDVRVTDDGGVRMTVPTDQGRREVKPGEFARLVSAAKADQREHGFLFVLFNITSWMGVAWVALGLGGQLAFTFRMLVQWVSSEKARRSVVPVSFWWMSLVGATMLVFYFVWRKDVVGVIGQSTGWVIYIRNLRLVYKHGSLPEVTADPGPEPELAE